jgi:hypothetical protein
MGSIDIAIRMIFILNKKHAARWQEFGLSIIVGRSVKPGLSNWCQGEVES